MTSIRVSDIGLSGRWGILAWCRLLEKQALPGRLVYKREI